MQSDIQWSLFGPSTTMKKNEDFKGHLGKLGLVAAKNSGEISWHLKRNLKCKFQRGEKCFVIIWL